MRSHWRKHPPSFALQLPLLASGSGQLLFSTSQTKAITVINVVVVRQKSALVELSLNSRPRQCNGLKNATVHPRTPKTQVDGRRLKGVKLHPDAAGLNSPKQWRLTPKSADTCRSWLKVKDFHGRLITSSGLNYPRELRQPVHAKNCSGQTWSMNLPGGVRGSLYGRVHCKFTPPRGIFTAYS